MSAAWPTRLRGVAADFLNEHWDEDWPWDDWDKEVGEFTTQLHGALQDAWVEFRDRKNADRMAVVMDARPE